MQVIEQWRRVSGTYGGSLWYKMARAHYYYNREQWSQEMVRCWSLGLPAIVRHDARSLGGRESYLPIVIHSSPVIGKKNPLTLASKC